MNFPSLRGYGQVPRERKSTSIQFCLYKVTDPTPSQLVADMDDNFFAQTFPYKTDHTYNLRLIDWLMMPKYSQL